eukprot:m.183271 g.183271  ORF g.183271 m.183271 type:complete len:61 (-) comp16649_c0_seq53:222-404(-)
MKGNPSPSPISSHLATTFAKKKSHSCTDLFETNVVINMDHLTSQLIYKWNEKQTVRKKAE